MFCTIFHPSFLWLLIFLLVLFSWCNIWGAIPFLHYADGYYFSIWNWINASRILVPSEFRNLIRLFGSPNMNINSIYYLFISLFSTYLASLLKTAFYANSCFFLFFPSIWSSGQYLLQFIIYFFNLFFSSQYLNTVLGLWFNLMVQTCLPVWFLLDTKNRSLWLGRTIISFTRIS